MAPGYLERLSDGILDAGLDIRWSAELRMEKIFLPDRCKKMAQSGCVCVSFGMESGNHADRERDTEVHARATAAPTRNPFAVIVRPSGSVAFCSGAVG